VFPKFESSFEEDPVIKKPTEEQRLVSIRLLFSKFETLFEKDIQQTILEPFSL